MAQLMTYRQVRSLNLRPEAEGVERHSTALCALISSPAFVKESETLRTFVLQLAVRLRCARVTLLATQLVKRLHRYHAMHLDQQVKQAAALVTAAVAGAGAGQRLDSRTGNIVMPDPVVLQQTLIQLSDSVLLLQQISGYCLPAFEDFTMYLRHGHLVQHFLVGIACLSRIHTIIRALIVHSCDLYQVLHKFMIRCHPSFISSIPASISK